MRVPRMHRAAIEREYRNCVQRISSETSLSMFDEFIFLNRSPNITRTSASTNRNQKYYG